MIESFYQDVISSHIGADEKLTYFQAVGGGCINNAIQLSTNNSSYFLKWNSSEAADMLLKEKNGLKLLNASINLKVPEVLGYGTTDKKAYLLLEWIDKGTMNDTFWEEFGVGLAKMHLNSKSEFGLDHDNYIGSLHQSNGRHATWSDFFINERINPQIKLARQNGMIDKNLASKFEKLNSQLGQLVPNEKPAFLHGDLWSGNFSSTSANLPVIFDPAVHYGHRETELAFTHLFGGFSPVFYRYYEDAYPLEQGFSDRIEIHNLYPLLVHVNLFGSSYLSGIVHTLKKYT